MASDGAPKSDGVVSAEDYLRSLPRDQLGPAARILLSYPRRPQRRASDVTRGELTGLAGEGSDRDRSPQLPLMNVVSGD